MKWFSLTVAFSKGSTCIDSREAGRLNQTELTESTYSSHTNDINSFFNFEKLAYSQK